MVELHWPYCGHTTVNMQAVCYILLVSFVNAVYFVVKKSYHTNDENHKAASWLLVYSVVVCRTLGLLESVTVRARLAAVVGMES